MTLVNHKKIIAAIIPVDSRKWRTLEDIKARKPTYKQLLRHRNLMGDIILSLSSKYCFMHHKIEPLGIVYKKESHRKRDFARLAFEITKAQIMERSALRLGSSKLGILKLKKKTWQPPILPV